MSDAVSHLPPQALESEEAIIGAMLMSNFAIEIAVDMRLAARDFYRPSHRVIFESVMSLFEQTGKVDELVVINQLKAANRLSEAGGAVAIATLGERVPAVANARAYAQDVLDVSAHRRTVEAGHAIAKLGYEHPFPPAQIVAEAGRIVDDLGDSRPDAGEEWTTLAAEFSALSDALQARKEAGNEVRGLTSGLEVIDRRIGGFQGSRLYIGAARPGMGKSGWLSGALEHIAIDLGKHVAMFNFEMNAEQQAARAAARLGNADLHRMTNALPTDADIEDLSQTSIRTFEHSPRMHINRQAVLTIGQIAQSSRRLNRKLKRDTGSGLAAIGVDYLQLIDTPGTRASERTGDVSEISRGLKLLAKELDVPVIALSQLNRSCEMRTPPIPELRDLRESGAIEQDADVVMFLYRPEYYFKAETPIEWQGKAQAIVAKCRDGVPGMDVLGWDGARTKFTHARNAQTRPFVVGGSREDIA